MTAEHLFDAFSEADPESNVPYLGTCTLIVGDGTQKVDFHNGRAKVPASFAHLVARHPHVTIPALEVEGYGEQDEAEVLDRDSQARVAELEAEIEAEKAKSSAKAKAKARKAKKQTAEEREAAIQAAREHLEEEGEEIPDVVTPGFEATTAEGAPRCQAPKSNGEQCSNPAVEDSPACRLPAHQAKFDEDQSED